MDKKTIENLSNHYEIDTVEVLLIAINRFGIISNIEYDRVRFYLTLKDEIEKHRLAVCVNTYDSPFVLKNNLLFFNDEIIGEVKDVELDTCDTSYFRKNGKVLVLNSNSRSTCKGCQFCGTYSLVHDDIHSLTTIKKIENHFNMLIAHRNINDFSSFEQVSIVTGCFDSSNELINHFEMLKIVLNQYKFNGKVMYLGSQLNTADLLEKSKSIFKNFEMIFTLECFTRREKMLNEKKRKEISEIKMIMECSKNIGIDTTYTLIAGLDELVDIQIGNSYLKKSITKMPIIQIMQNYDKKHEALLVKEANNIEYFLKIRKTFEKNQELNLKIYPWENYRGLWKKR